MEWKNIVVKIIVKSKVFDFNNPLNSFKTESSSGTGFFIKKNLILTCYHVVKYAVNIEVLYQHTNNIEAKIKHIFPDDDLAIIELDKEIDSSVVLEFKPIKSSQQIGDVYTVGFPLGSTNIKETKGIVSGFQGSLIQSDATINPGNSGGPMIVMEKENEISKYYIIGINVSKMTRIAEGTGYIVPIKRFMILQKIIEKHPNRIVIKKPLLFFKFQKLIQKKFRKIIFRNHPDLINMMHGVIVTKINERFYLNQYIKRGDVILSINGKEVDYNGMILIDKYPEKIPLHELGLWFVEGDIIKIEIFDIPTQKIRTETFTLQVIKTNIPDFYGFDDESYFVEKDGLIFSILTREHLKKFKELELYDEENILQIIKNKSHHTDVFTVYLSDLNFNKLKNQFIKYPVGSIIMEINGIVIDSYKTFMETLKQPIQYIKTLNDEIYFVGNMEKNERKYLISYNDRK
jgi:S1-C subfamily serine protease